MVGTKARAFRRTIAVSIPAVMVAAVLAVPTSAVDTSSTSGVRIVTVPFGGSMDAVAMVNDTIGLEGDSGIWSGSGPIFRLRTDLPAGATNISIEDMNASGDVVGSYKISGVEFAYKWSAADGHTPIPAPAAMVVDSNIFEATGISDDGWIVGIYRAEANTCGFEEVNPCGFLAIPSGSSYTVTTFTGQPVYAYFGAQDIELVTVGATTAHVAVGFGLVWSDDDPDNPWHLLDVGTNTSSTFLDAVDINRTGGIVGTASIGGADLGAAYWASPVASLTELAPLPGHTRSHAYALNDAGTIVGFSGPTPSEGTAVYWTAFAPGANDLGHLTAGTLFSSAYAINEQGIIVGESAGDAVIWDVAGDYEVGAVIEIEPIADDVAEPGGLIERTFTWSGTPGLFDPSSSVAILGGAPGNPILFGATESSVNFMWFAPIEPGVHQFTFEVISPYVGIPNATETFTLTVAPSTGPISISITEAVVVSDSVTVSPPVVISITEAVSVSDSVTVSPPVVISITEAVSVSDSVTVSPPVVISITEAVVVTDQVDVPTEDPDGDIDSDGIANSVDTDRSTPSTAFSDVPLAGTTFGEIADSSQQDVRIADAADSAKGVTIATGDGPADDYGVIELCSEAQIVHIWSNTEATFTCGSLTVEVEIGLVTLVTSDGAELEVGPGSSVHLDDDGGTVTVEVLAGTAILRVGGSTIVLGVGHFVENPGDPDFDHDSDGLSTNEEALTGTNPIDSDTDGDNLLDGVDPTWLDSYVAALPDDVFQPRWSEFIFRHRIAMLHLAVSLGDRSSALRLISSIERRTDGCGSTPHRNDWIKDCDTQTEFTELLDLLKRNIGLMELPDRPPRQGWRTPR